MTMKLELVRIYFDATSFDQINKDRSNTAIDKLSAIGGTMGLLTAVWATIIAVNICKVRGLKSV